MLSADLFLSRTGSSSAGSTGFGESFSPEKICFLNLCEDEGFCAAYERLKLEFPSEVAEMECMNQYLELTLMVEASRNEGLEFLRGVAEDSFVLARHGLMAIPCVLGGAAAFGVGIVDSVVSRAVSGLGGYGSDSVGSGGGRGKWLMKLCIFSLMVRPVLSQTMSASFDPGTQCLDGDAFPVGAQVCSMSMVGATPKLSPEPRLGREDAQGLVFQEKLYVSKEGGDYFRGYTKDGYPDNGALYRPDGSMRFEGQFKDGKPFKGKTFFSDGKVSFEGDFLDGKPYKGVSYDNNGDLFFKEEFRGNAPYDGERYLNNKLFKGIFGSDGAFVKGQYYVDGRLHFDGEFKNGKEHYGKVYNADGKLLFKGLIGSEGAFFRGEEYDE